MASNRPERPAPISAQRSSGDAYAHPADGRVEADLMARACDGDRNAYGQLVGRLGDRIFNAMLRIVGDPEEARELTQETFTRGLAKLDSFRAEAGPYTWLFRIGMNLAISQLRKVERRRTFSLDGAMPGRDGAGDARRGSPIMRLASDTESPLDDLERRERAQQVVAALGRLDPEYRAALVMRDIEGFDYQTMADALNLPLGTLKSRLFRARLALRDELAPYLKGGSKPAADGKPISDGKPIATELDFKPPVNQS